MSTCPNCYADAAGLLGCWMCGLRLRGGGAATTDEAQPALRAPTRGTARTGGHNEGRNETRNETRNEAGGKSRNQARGPSRSPNAAAKADPFAATPNRDTVNPGWQFDWAAPTTGQRLRWLLRALIAGLVTLFVAFLLLGAILGGHAGAFGIIVALSVMLIAFGIARGGYRRFAQSGYPAALRKFHFEATRPANALTLTGRYRFAAPLPPALRKLRWVATLTAAGTPPATVNETNAGVYQCSAPLRLADDGRAGRFDMPLQGAAADTPAQWLAITLTLAPAGRAWPAFPFVLPNQALAGASPPPLLAPAQMASAE